VEYVPQEQRGLVQDDGPMLEAMAVRLALYCTYENLAAVLLPDPEGRDKLCNGVFISETLLGAAVWLDDYY
jgi:hypothetical protein